MVLSLCVFVLTATLVGFAVSAVLPTLYEGDVCRLGGGRKGLCKPLSQCQPAYQRLLQSRIKPIHCGFKGFEEIVCCDDEFSQGLRKSELACREYMNELPLRVNPFILGGEAAEPGDYPHMAALGYVDTSESSQIQWKCGGTLISDRYVLTAAHCVVPSPRTKPPVHVLLGAVNLNEPDFLAQKYHVKNWTRHPEYSTARAYNDIALIELDRTVKFSENIQPACLNTKSDIKEFGLEVTGWGAISNSRQATSPTLQHATLSLIPNDKCNESYVSERRLNRGVQDTMLCAGDPQGKMDTCNGDSGGPLQVRTPETTAYSIVGVTSIGPAVCGGSTPAIYTRVNKYVDWIESVVWN